MRKFHRWVMTVFAALLAYWVGSGLTLASYDVIDRNQEWVGDGGGPGAQAPRTLDGLVIDSAQPLSEADITPMAQATFQAAKDALPGQSVADVELRIVDGVRQGIVTIGRGSAERLTFDTQTGALLARAATVKAAPPNRHTVIKSWHSGSVLGIAGNALALCAGASLCVLVLTGATLYVQMWRMRSRLRKKSLFWR
jgi:uncharacterized iron-regulated membrane protein